MNTLIEAHNKKMNRLSSVCDARRSVELDFFTEASNKYRAYQGQIKAIQKEIDQYFNRLDL